ncbi:hypothetical protein RND81_05G048300 [Saponaria officinalis]|uniref:NB-ARC domain-containing protein n=1 Tax=Saponaria officinalis TaxID=3572 RepID=A0AAW1KTA4_SAPOF
MSNPTVTVVTKRIRFLLEEHAEILQQGEDQLHGLLFQIEDLASYLEQLVKEKDQEILLYDSNNESEDDAVPNFILKDGSKSILNTKSLRRFLMEITYEFEDVIDTIIYKNISEGMRSCSLLRNKVFKHCFRIESQEMLGINNITTRMDKALKDINAFQCLDIMKAGQYKELSPWGERPRQGLPPTPITPHNLVGIRKDIDILIEKLTRKGHLAQVLYMVGIDGSGKTTMASEVYNHPAIRQHFASFIWADVSRLRDAKDILLEIIWQARGGNEVLHRTDSIKEIANKLSNIIKQRPYLIILDDLEDPEDLATHLLPVIQNSGNISKIVITTRVFPQHPYKHEEYIVGSDEDIDSLAKNLVMKDAYEASIFHTPKTQATKLLLEEFFKNPRVSEHFNFRIWVDVEDEWDTKTVLVKVLKVIKNESLAEKSTEELVEHLQVGLRTNKYLIVPDQVDKGSQPENFWNTKTVSFEVLKILNDKNLGKESVRTLVKHLEACLQRKKYLIVLDQVDIERQLVDARETNTVLLKVLEVLNNESLLKESMETLRMHLLASLQTNNYLIVLDQVDKAQQVVDVLLPIFATAEHKSKVILVTNNPPSQLQNNDIAGQELLDADRLAKRLTGEGDQPILFSIIDMDHSSRKTLLAKKLYDHPRVNHHFDNAKVWISISKDWDANAALSQIIRQITGDNQQLPNSSTEMAKLLLNELAQKMYLIVLDDIGDAEDLVFELLAEISRTSHKRKDIHKSRLIITADNPRIMQQSTLKSILYAMRPLTEDESWQLLCSIAVNQAENSKTTQTITNQFDREPPENRFHKYKMLAKCKGIPLAITALGGLLSTKGTAQEWKSVFTSLKSVETPMQEVLKDVLLLCYDDLPDDVVPCLLYLALFPRHSEIPTGMLVRMWISEGLVTLDSPRTTHQTLEDIASNYLEELACRCMIEVVRRNHMGKMKHIKLHDQIHELLIKTSAELGFIQEYLPSKMNERPLQQAGIRSRKEALHTRERLLRRTAIQYGEQNIYPTKSSNLRSFVQFGKHGASGKDYYFQHETLSLMLEPIQEHFKLLRVLILSGIRTSNILPKSIGYLIFLTYLGLRATNIQVLPETIGNLRKLVTLDYRGTLELGVCAPLPSILSRMTELRHLFLPECTISCTKALDLRILRNLQTLWGVAGGDWLTKGFVGFGPSLMKLGIVRISSKKELESILYWLTIISKELRVLKLDWHTANGGKLQFPENLYSFECLHKLSLIGRLKEEYDFTLIPSLVKLELFFSHLEKYDPTTKLGRLPRLKILTLWNSYKGSQWTCGSGSFPELEELHMSHLTNLEEWIVEEGALPKLKRLSIFSCRKLKRIPEGLSSLHLQQLEILDMSGLFRNDVQEWIQRNAAQEGSHTMPNIKFEGSME